MKVVSQSAITGNTSDLEYGEYLARIQARFEANSKQVPLFTTDATNLFNTFLYALPPTEQPFHQCHACRRFIEHFGSLVTIAENGETLSAIWNLNDAYDLYVPSVTALLRVINASKANGVFLSSDTVWGTPKTGDWCHFGLRPAKDQVYKNSVTTAGQARAEKLEDFKNICVALADYTIPTLEQAIRLLESDTLYRSEKVLGAAQWLRDLQVARKEASRGNANNVVWRAIATAPAGFCHPRSSMIGTLLDDIASGKNFDEVSRSFAAKMHPLKYQRPQAAPSAGTIAQAEKIVAQLDASGSLRRRYAKLDEVVALWTPRHDEEPTNRDGSVFGHLRPKGARVATDIEIPAVNMTWDKFQRVVLPSAQRIEFYTNGKGYYCTLVTAVDPEAAPILQWDYEDERNPASWYVWHGGSLPSQYGLPDRSYINVEAITLKPCQWGARPITHQGEGVLLLLSGARETQNSGSAIFPETLRSEFHAIRSVIEAHSRSSKLEPIDEPHAIGPILGKGEAWNARVRVTSNGQKSVYILDRWD